ncbi:MAG: hypothetical protein FWH22_11145 [Fibromonadales bacterium]|nr:hypothetical protein [Fibromonadales bacterium]
MITVFIDHVKRLNFKFLIGLGAFCVLVAAVNNIRAPKEKSVEWIGGQEILKGPE